MKQQQHIYMCVLQITSAVEYRDLYQNKNITTIKHLIHCLLADNKNVFDFRI